MEQLGPLPSADAVLNKVKSDGTFDQFRKTCLATVEAEPSIRAYGEQIEVLSRRYLQDHYHKWSNSITKNEVRAKLKDYILTMIANPDVGIGIPLQTMVEKSLEKNGPKVLLPQIMDAVDTLRDTKPQTSSSPDKPAGASSDPVEESKGLSLEGVASGKAGSELGPLDLPLPISIPGLNTTGGRKESVCGGEPGSKPKPKSKAGGESSVAVSAAKEGGKAVAKASTLKGISGKPTGAKDGLKQKEKEEKTSAEEKEVREPSQADEGTSKEKGRSGSSVKSKRPSKDEKEKPVQREKEVAEKQKAPATGAAKEKDSSTEVKEGSGRRDSSAKREKEQKEPVKREQKTETKEAKLEQKKGNSKEQEGQEEVEEVCEAEESKPISQPSVSGSSRRKQAAPKRRSARLASLNEETSEDQERVTGEKAKGNKVAEETEVREEGKAAEAGRRKDTQAEKSRSLSAPKAAGRKRMRLLDSSSEESDALQQSNSEEEEKGYESETEQGKEEEEEKRPKRKRLRGREVTRCGPSTEDSGSKDSSGKGSRKRTIGSSKESKEEWSDNSANKKARKSATRQEAKQSHKQMARVKSPSPVVVTRYNRRVKPNRRYNSPSGEQSASSNEGGEATPPT